MRRTLMKRSQTIFYGLFLFSLLFSAVYLAARRGAGLEGFIFDGGGNLFGDFINNLHYPTHEGGPYFDSVWATFPPLAYTFYYLFNVAFTRANYAYELLAYTMITAATAVLMLYAVQRIFERYRGREGAAGQGAALCLCLLLSGVSVFTIERGNSVFNVMVALLFAVYLRDSDRAWQRELALVLIAAAAGFKVYPCLLGVLYLLERRWREAVRLVIYGAVLFFVPFAWFGGMDGFWRFLQNHQEIHSAYRTDYLTSIPSALAFLGAEFGWNAGATVTAGRILSLLYGAAALVCVCLSKKLWQRCLLLFGVATLVPGWSCEYMAIYMAVPLSLFMAEEGGRMNGMNALYMALFGGVFILLPFGADGLELHSGVSWNMLVCFACLYLIQLAAMADALAAFRRNKKQIAAAPLKGGME